MKILYVVHGYGEEVIGGAEAHCRLMAELLAARGHDVTVATSCAKSYVTWQNHYKPGNSVLNRVAVERFAVTKPRDAKAFGLMSQRVLIGYKPTPRYLQQDWLMQQGPVLVGFAEWLADHASEYDVVIGFSYLYWPTFTAMLACRGQVPLVLHPLAHDEPPLHLPLYGELMGAVDGLVFNIEEEAALVQRVFPQVRATSLVLGIGTERDVPADEAAFREFAGLPTEPYLLCVGRVDPHKGSDELFDQFVEYKARRPEAQSLKLVYVGPVAKPLPDHEDVRVLGVVTEKQRRGALAGAHISMHPSYFESFSMALIEAFAARKPAIVNRRCEVLAGQVERSGGGLAVASYGEFEAALDLLLAEDELRSDLGAAGQRFVEERFEWKMLLTRYEEFLERTIHAPDRTEKPS